MLFLNYAHIRQISFQNPASPLFEGIINLHHNIFFYLLIILFLVLTITHIIYLRTSVFWERPHYVALTRFREFYFRLTSLNHGTLLELFWTIVPTLILLFIVLPSFALLYSTDEVIYPTITIKAIGHQWYWTYELQHQTPLKLVNHWADVYEVNPKFDIYAWFKNNTKKINNINTFLYPSIKKFPNFDTVNLFAANFYNNITPETFTLKNILKNISMADHANSHIAFQHFYKEVNKSLPHKFDIDIQNYINLYNKTLCLISAEFNSYIRAVSSLELGDLRLLEVDHPLVCPINTHLRLLVTSTDVIHSWTVPSLGVKVDCVPGRLNQAMIFINRPGVYYGQCSELCGIGHAFMPIQVIGV